MAVYRFIDEDDWDTAIDVGSGVRMLHAAKGETRYMVEHRCKAISMCSAHQIINPECEVCASAVWMIIAPYLSPGHRVVHTSPLTIEPSILCPDCGLHGYVTAGVWRDV